tara:strand:+ start:898 stop:1593 length:696 start_codon:yes stop_codon:yes gene_type:complete
MRGVVFKLFITVLLIVSYDLSGQEIFKTELIEVTGFFNFSDTTLNIEVYNKTDSVIFLRDSEFLYVTEKTDSGIINIRCSSIFLPQPWPPQPDIQFYEVSAVRVLPKETISFKFFETYPNMQYSDKSNLELSNFRFVYNMEYIIAKEQFEFKDDLPNYLFVQKILKKNLNVYRFYGVLEFHINEPIENCYSVETKEVYSNGIVRVPNLLSKESKKAIRRINRANKSLHIDK